MNVLITGCSRGIGYELVKVFADQGHKVIAMSRNLKPLQNLKSQIKDFEGKLVLLQLDLLKINEQKKNLVGILETHDIRHIDIMINNAGLLYNKGFDSYHFEEIEKMVYTNFISPSLLLRELIPFLLKSEFKAHVVNITSMGGYQGSSKFPGLSYYSASKAALATLTECLAEEYKDNDIAFNNLALGAVQTEMLEEAFPGYKAPVNAYDMAQFINDFALKGHKFFNGKTIPVSTTTP